MPIQTTTDPKLAAAKAQLIKVASEIDPLAPLRKHPYITIAVALTTGAVLGSTADAVIGAAVLGKTTNTVFNSLVKVVEGFKAARGEKTAAKPGTANANGTPK